MELQSGAAAGQARLDTLSIDCRVRVGHTLVVSYGLPNEELITVAGFGSILTVDVLRNAHAAGEIVELPGLPAPPLAPAQPGDAMLVLQLVFDASPTFGSDGDDATAMVQAAAAAALAASSALNAPGETGGASGGTAGVAVVNVAASATVQGAGCSLSGTAERTDRVRRTWRGVDQSIVVP